MDEHQQGRWTIERLTIGERWFIEQRMCGGSRGLGGVHAGNVEGDELGIGEQFGGQPQVARLGDPSSGLAVVHPDRRLFTEGRSDIGDPTVGQGSDGADRGMAILHIPVWESDGVTVRRASDDDEAGRDFNPTTQTEDPPRCGDFEVALNHWRLRAGRRVDSNEVPPVLSVGDCEQATVAGPARQHDRFGVCVDGGKNACDRVRLAVEPGRFHHDQLGVIPRHVWMVPSDTHQLATQPESG